ncbi:MAG: TlyA family RNA methyltransferase [Actinobacteria bacterium]|nr:TlyA family RNA methyltransferase [Actinomycetota bacterium]
MRRRLDTELVRRHLVGTRTQAVEAIASGRVFVRGAPARNASRQVDADEPIQLEGEGPRFVSRGGEKLEHALSSFSIDVRGARCIDAGASTGGFTDCLLQHGAAHVVAVDVGHGQLAWKLRHDDRVTVLERTNIRELAPADVGGTAPVLVADLSFISLRTVAPALARLTDADAHLVLLVKPQFEAGRGRVGRGGVVREAAVHLEVLRDVARGLFLHGLVMNDVVPSPIRGADGNVEFVAHVTKQGELASGERLAAMVEHAHGGGA